MSNKILVWISDMIFKEIKVHTTPPRLGSMRQDRFAHLRNNIIFISSDGARFKFNVNLWRKGFESAFVACCDALAVENQLPSLPFFSVLLCSKIEQNLGLGKSNWNELKFRNWPRMEADKPRTSHQGAHGGLQQSQDSVRIFPHFLCLLRSTITSN